MTATQPQASRVMVDREVPLWHGQKFYVRTIPVDWGFIMTAKEQADLCLDLVHIRNGLRDIEAADEENHQKLAQIRQHLNAIIVALSITHDLSA